MWANTDHVSVLLYDTNLILHALCSAGAGAGVCGVHGLLLILLLQFGVLGVHTLHICWRMQHLVRLLDTLKRNSEIDTVTLNLVVILKIISRLDT